MTASKSLPPRPSLDSLRKQAKKLARERSLTQRQAQLVLAREYGFAGWLDLTAEVSKRLGNDFEWIVKQAHRAIHTNDLAGLKKLLGEHPALLSWQGDHRHQSLLEMATGAYGDAFGAEREHWFTRAASAELLIEQGAIILPQVAEGILQSRAVGLLHLFQRKNLLPRTLKFHAALGDLEAVRASLDANASDPAVVNEAFLCASRFHHESVASVLLESAIALDPELGEQVEMSIGRAAFVKYAVEPGLPDAAAVGLWKAFVMQRVSRAVHDPDLTTFIGALGREPWLLGDGHVDFQNGIIGTATLNDRGEFISALLDLNPAILRRQPPPPSQAIEFAMTYGTTHLLPLLTRIWPLPDDLPHAAGMGNLTRVTEWFDAAGAPALGDLENHYPRTSLHLRKHDDLHWGAPTAQHVLDTALAWSVINRHFDVADFLLEHGANVNTDWNSHEPASILHHLVFEDNYASMQYLIDRGIDMTIRDYRWNATARGWAFYAKNDEKMAKWLEEAERNRDGTEEAGSGL
jgi:hypothetical protein